MLSVTSLWLDGELSVLSDSNDTIAIETQLDLPSGNLEVVVMVNGVEDTSVPQIAPSEVRAIIVEGGDLANWINLQAVDSTEFSYADPVSGDPMSVRVEGHNGDDTIFGTAGFGDTIFGGDGDDFIDGREGDDVIHGNDGADTIYGQDGADTIDGGDGKDEIFGSFGDDQIDGGDGSDTISGGDDNDVLSGGDYDDEINGDAGDDTLNGGSGIDTLRGDSGNDSIRGGGAADVIEGGDGDDHLNGQGGADSIVGGDGDDSMIGGGGRDTLQGNNGNDRISGSGGNDLLVGDVGDDSLYGGSGNDLLYGDSSDPNVTGNGSDKVRGQGGHDTLYGGGGADWLEGGTGNDLIDSFLPQLTLILIDDPIVEAEGDTASLSVYSADFENGVPDEFTGFTTVTSVQGYAGIGTASNVFAGDFLQNDSGCCTALPTTPQTATRMTLFDLPKHESVDIDFLLAIINSWNDANDSMIWGPDEFVVTVDGIPVFSENFRNLDGLTQGYLPPAGVALTPAPLTDLGFPGPSLPLDQNDSAYNMGLDPAFDAIPHVASTLTVEWYAGGVGWEGGADESWGIDNIEVTLNGVPIQTTATFNVMLSDPTDATVTVDYSTSDFTALAGFDYESAAGTVTFAPGETQQTIDVTILGDDVVEGDETFQLDLFNSANGWIGDFQGIATIVDDDQPLATTYWPENVGGPTDARAFVVQLNSSVDAMMLGTMLGVDIQETDLIENTFIMSLADGQDPTELSAQLAGMPGVAHFYPLETHVMTTKAIPNDPLYPNQWHLDNTGQTGGTAGMDVNAEGVWDNYRGNGIVIGIVDDGLQHTHPDLITNYDAANSFDFIGNDADPDPAVGDNHGTMVAGLAGGVGFNTLGISGVAPSARLAGLLLVAPGMNDQLEANAISYQNQQIHIYNNSWGPPDAGQGLDVTADVNGPGPLMLAALANGAVNGRGGLGSIYTWAGGNGGAASDNVNYDGYANSRFTIAVGAIDHNGVQSTYSEPGAPLVITAYANDGSGFGMVTTDLIGTGNLSNDYTDQMNGTSAAVPVVSGVIALMLEANPNLTSRDVTHVLVNSAKTTDGLDPEWFTNAGGHLVNHKYGFGAIDADVAVTTAVSWANVGPEIFQTSGVIDVAAAIPDSSTTGVASTVGITDDIVLEYVEVVVNMTHTRRGDLEVVLTSPGGTDSILAEMRNNDSVANYANWVFTSARHWDESSVGDWTLSVRDLATGETGTLDNWALNLYGTAGIATPPPPPPPPPTTPQGPDYIGDTLNGNSGQDTLRGALGGDRLNGGGGNDLLRAGGGNDLVLGGGGRDTLGGGPGNDTLNGQGGIDTVDGDDDDDKLIWQVGASSDSFSGTNGFDELIVQGNSANNRLTVSESPTGNIQISDNTYRITATPSVTRITINAASGNDRITIEDVRGASGVLLVVNGQNGGDTINASGADLGNVRLLVQGGDGDDTITGSDNDDLLRGEAGNDLIDGGAGDDTIDGGDNNDSLAGGAGDDEITGGIHNDTIAGGDGNDLLRGQDGHDSLTGDAGDDSLIGNDGNDVLNGSAGDDLLEGSDGRDTLLGGTGADTLDGGVDDDSLTGQGGDDVLAGRHGNDTIDGGTGDDLINGGDGHDTINGGSGDDILGGHDGDDRLNGGAGDDVLVGGDGHDTLLGGGGRDTAVGGDGDDFINGNGSTDIIAGNEGDDQLGSNLSSEIDEAFQLGSSILDLLDQV